MYMGKFAVLALGLLFVSGCSNDLAHTFQSVNDPSSITC
jgi:hypothetical protein